MIPVSVFRIVNFRTRSAISHALLAFLIFFSILIPFPRKRTR